jgi:hypothetical protein
VDTRIFLRAKAEKHLFVRNLTTAFHPVTSLPLRSAAWSPFVDRTAIPRTLMWTILVFGMKVIQGGIVYTLN